MRDRQLIAYLLSALGYRVKQTRPIEFIRVVIEAAREYLKTSAQSAQAKARPYHVFNVTKSGALTAWEPTAMAFALPDGKHALYTAPQQAEAGQYTRADLDRAYSAGLVEGERLAIQQAEAVPAWTTEQITAVARPIAMAIAENCRTAPQLVFPYLFLGLKDLLTSTPPQQAEAVRPTTQQVKAAWASPDLPLAPPTPIYNFVDRLFDAMQIKQAEAVPPIYYMRDNHTFKCLSGCAETAMLEIEQEFNSGWTHGTLCSKRKGFDPVHANGSNSRLQFFAKCKDALDAAIAQQKG